MPDVLKIVNHEFFIHSKFLNGSRIIAFEHSAKGRVRNVFIRLDWIVKVENWMPFEKH